MTNPAEKKAVRSVPPTLGARMVRELRQRLGGAHLARRLGVSETLLRQVGSSERNPGPALRDALAAPGLDVPLSAWSPPPSPTLATDATIAPSPFPVAAPPPPAGPGGDEAVEVGSTLVELNGQVARLKRQALAADADPSCSIRDKAAVAAALNHALRARARALGEEEVSRGRLLASREWRDLRDLLANALAPDDLAPARRVILKAIQEFSGGAS